MLWVHAYWWLEANNLWKATVAFGVTLVLGGAVSLLFRPWKLWREHRDAQVKIADRLDPSTPGGITVLLDALSPDQACENQGSADDNGSDRKTVPGHGIPGTHGGGSATHR